MAKKGRPSLRTKVRKDRIVQAIAAGNYVETAARYGGVHPATYYRWMQEAQEPGAAANKREFYEAVKKAEAEAEVRNVATIQLAASSQWQAAAWLLERKHPAQWGRRMEVVGPEGGPIKLEVKHSVDHDAYEREYSAILEGVGPKRLPAPSGNGTGEPLDPPDPQP